MGGFIKTDLKKLFRSKSFIISAVVVFVVNIAAKLLNLLMFNLANSIAASSDDSALSAGVSQYNYKAGLSSVFIDPMGISILLIVVLISAAAFLYSGIANGSTGKTSGHTVISKLIVLSIHNTIFFLIGMIGYTVGQFITGGSFDIDAQNIPFGLAAFFSKWFVVQAMTVIMLFVSTGMKNKSLSSIIGVIFGSCSLAVIYFMIDDKFRQIAQINLADNAPSSLIQTGTNFIVIDALFVSIAIIAIFIPLTITVFKKNKV